MIHFWKFMELVALITCEALNILSLPLFGKLKEEYLNVHQLFHVKVHTYFFSKVHNMN